MVRGAEAFHTIAVRLSHDLALRFPSAVVRFRQEEDDWVCEIVDGGIAWGFVSVSPDASDALDSTEVERLVADVAFDAVNNLWPDEAIDAWPLCPTPRDHPLQIGVRFGRASWICLHNEAIAVPIGSLADRP